MKQTWPAPERNKGPILDVLARVLPGRGRVLEIASGSGQHAVHFAAHLPGLTWLPSDVDEENLASVRAWRAESGLSNLASPLRVDVLDSDWGVGEVEAIFNANMIHITPWECAEGLVRGVGRHLAPRGVFVLYGPFQLGGSHTAPSNEAFDENLKKRNPSWGVRDAEAVIELAASVGVAFVERVDMPANNLALVFVRTSKDS